MGLPAAEAAALVRCSACGLELPAYARFCAGCGTPQPHPVGSPPDPQRDVRYPAWLVALFWVGSGLALVIAALYAAVAVTPSLSQGSGLDMASVRPTAIVAATVSAALFALQSVSAVGLTRQREWARVPATLACVGWALTCVGLLIAIPALLTLWRPERPR